MLALMLAVGIVSRIGSGFMADRLGGVVTLLIGSVAQMAALVLYLVFDGLTSLYVVSALFGLFQGGLVPSYAIIVRESFPAGEAGARVGIILMMTVLAWRWAAGCPAHIRPDRVLSRCLCQWHGLECTERPDRPVPADPHPPPGRSTTCQVGSRLTRLEQFLVAAEARFCHSGLLLF